VTLLITVHFSMISQTILLGYYEYRGCGQIWLFLCTIFTGPSTTSLPIAPSWVTRMKGQKRFRILCLFFYNLSRFLKCPSCTGHYPIYVLDQGPTLSTSSIEHTSSRREWRRKVEFKPVNQENVGLRGRAPQFHESTSNYYFPHR